MKRPEKPLAPGRREWYDYPRWGRCQGCGRHARRQAHHAVREQDVVRKAPERIYDLANRMLLGVGCCHGGHHRFGVNDTRLPLACVPELARAFAVEVLGEWQAEDHWRRYYS